MAEKAMRKNFILEIFHPLAMTFDLSWNDLLSAMTAKLRSQMQSEGPSQEIDSAKEGETCV